MRWVSVLVLLASSLAHADVIKIAQPANAMVERAKLDVWLHPDRTSVRLTLVVAGIDGQARDVEVPLELPADARVTELSMSTAAVDPTRASAIEPAQARIEYGRSRQSSALLEFSETRYLLGVAGVTRARAMTVVLGFSTSRHRAIGVVPVRFSLAQLEIELAGDGVKSRSQSWRDVAARRGVELPAPPRTLSEPLAIGKAVDGQTSLIAIAKVRPVIGPTITIGPTHTSDCDFRTPPIKRYVKLQIPRLRHCYMREAQRDPTLAGIVDLTFLIATDGTVTLGPQFGGTLANANVHACLREELATWRFGPLKNPILVHYPLTFRLGP